jgi:hypothetical protein
MTEQAYVVSIEVDGRQGYIFETDRLREMLGASRLIQQTVDRATELFKPEDALHLFQPVSGEIRVWAPVSEREVLLKRTWELRSWLTERGIEHSCACMRVDRKHFEEANDEPAHFEHGEAPDLPDLSWVQRALTARVGFWKGRKPGVDASPTCSLFSPCQIHGRDFATEWRTGAQRDRQDDRRNLRGRRAATKFEAWEMAKRDLFKTRLYEPAKFLNERIELATGKTSRRPIYFDHLSNANLDGADQFIAFICADGDGMGQVLSRINWNHTSLKRHGAPWEVNLKFALALDRCVNEAYGRALTTVLDEGFVEEALRSSEDRPVILPLLPQLLGGDDLWTLCRKDIALPFCCEFGDEYQRRITGSEIIDAAVRTAGALPEDLTISMGVAFAKAGHPAHAMIDSAESLLRSAKSLRKAQATATEGCIDWYWIDSSRADSVLDARADWRYEAEGVLHRLTSRPWTISQCRTHLQAAGMFNNGFAVSEKKTLVPRRKREQLEGILRRGGALADLGWEAWLKGLTADELQTVHAVAREVGKAGLSLTDAAEETAVKNWQLRCFHSTDPLTRTTPFLDLLDLYNLQGPAGEATDD